MSTTGKTVSQKFSKIVVDSVEATEYSKEGTETAQLRQQVKTITSYPGKRVDSDLQDNIFDANEFGFEPIEYESMETRMAWIPVPEGTSKTKVTNTLKKFTDAKIYRILSNHPIIDNNQKRAIANPDLNLTKDMIADRQALRYPEGHEFEGQLILDPNGKVQYRATKFAKAGHDDVDHRTSEASDVYMTAKIKQEIMTSSADDELVAVEEELDLFDESQQI